MSTTGSSRYRPLQHEEIRALAELMAAMLTPAMITGAPGPLTEAAWMAAKAMRAIALLLDPSPEQDFDRRGWLREVAYCGERVRQHGHRLVAAESTEPELATATLNEQINVSDVQALVEHARVALVLPDTGRTVTVEVALLDTDAGVPSGSWATWWSEDVALDAVDGYTHLEVVAALSTLGERLGAALNPDGTLIRTPPARAVRQAEAVVLTGGGRQVRHVHTQGDPRRAWEIRLPRRAARPGVVECGLLGVPPAALTDGRGAPPEVGPVIGPQVVRWNEDMLTVSLAFSIPIGGEVVLVYEPTPEDPERADADGEGAESHG